MKKYGFVRVGSIVNKLVLADSLSNGKEIVKMIKKASKEGVAIVSTPELCITGYTCQDLFLQDELITKSYEALGNIVKETEKLDIISILGMPIKVDNQMFNCAVVVSKGKILGAVPKTYVPNYSEFYEKRWFQSSTNLISSEVELLGEVVPIGTDILFKDKDVIFGVEICEDVWCVTPPSNAHTLHGANIIFNLSSSNEVIGKYEYRKNLVAMQSAKTICAYVYTSSGMMESTSDLLFGGASMIYENGSLLKENERFQIESNLIYADVDIAKLNNDRAKNISYMGVVGDEKYRYILVDVFDSPQELSRVYPEYPFVPKDISKRDERCQEIFTIQASALARRLIQLNYPKCVIGISGGLDSTLAFLVIVEAYKKLGLDNKDIIGVTMPGFGTTGRTYNNACKFVQSYGATLREVSIKEASLLHMKDIGLKEDDRSVTYENIQARERTQILMDIANMEGGLVIGTGDLSELALGWCTYNGDHMSMYSVNSSIPKTLVRYLVNWVADKSDDVKKAVIYDILDTPISPELLPPDKAGNILQQTESSIGPYVLHDFFLYHFLRYGATPKKIFYLASQTFKGKFDDETIKKWLKVFVKRFFTQQFKRNCVPDGVKVGSVSLSPRGDLRMPSDANYTVWIKEIDELD